MEGLKFIRHQTPYHQSNQNHQLRNKLQVIKWKQILNLKLAGYGTTADILKRGELKAVLGNANVNNYMLNWTVTQLVHFKVKWIKNCQQIYVITRPKQRLWPVQCTIHSHRIIILSRCRGWWRNRLWQKLRFRWGFSPRWRLRCRCRRRKILSQV